MSWMDLGLGIKVDDTFLRMTSRTVWKMLVWGEGGREEVLGWVPVA
jgi:hypothetical protein